MNETMNEDQITYSASARCPCGAGLAYHDDISPNGSWDCSAILLGTAVPSGQPGALQHTAPLPFMFYEIKSEYQPSVYGATTRPSGVARVRPEIPTPVPCPTCGK